MKTIQVKHHTDDVMNSQNNKNKKQSISRFLQKSKIITDTKR